MTCWQCVNYRAGGDGFISAYCDAGKTGFPFIGNKCAKFEYEPGADKETEKMSDSFLERRCLSLTDYIFQ